MTENTDSQEGPDPHVAELAEQVETQTADRLAVAIEGLSHEAADIRRELRESTAEQGKRISAQEKHTRAIWFGAAVAGVLLVVVVVAAFTVTLGNRRAIDDNNRRWCPVLGALVPGPTDPQPTDERGRFVVEQMRSQYEQYGCPKK